MTLNEEQTLFCRAIADAIAAWSQVEMSLALLFSTLLSGTHSNGKAQFVFYTVENFRSKLQLVDALASEMLEDKLLETWKNLERRIGSRAKKRNRIVHHERAINENAKPGQRFALIQPMLRVTRKRPVESMYVSDIRAASDECYGIGKEIRAFSHALETAWHKEWEKQLVASIKPPE